ncbi:hypothetical protein [Dickeya oryzae]
MNLSRIGLNGAPRYGLPVMVIQTDAATQSVVERGAIDAAQ